MRDTLTRRVCQEHSIECLLSEDFDRDPNGGFAKARAINRGLDQLRGDGWLLHLDADIALPYDLHPCLADAHLLPDRIYGVDRLNVVGEEQWAKIRAHGLYSRENGWLTEFRNRREGAWMGGRPAGIGIGWAPIGFFQLWHAAHTLAWGFPRRRYPETHGNATRTDVQFALQWDRRHRVLIPELVVFHLESEPSAMGMNWNGRKSRAFGEAGTAKPKDSYC